MFVIGYLLFCCFCSGKSISTLVRLGGSGILEGSWFVCGTAVGRVKIFNFHELQQTDLDT